MHSRGGGAANSGFVGRHVTPDGNCFARGHNRAGAPRDNAENCSKPLKICVFAFTESTGLQPQQDSRLDDARWRYDGHTSHRQSKQSDLDDGKCVLTNRDSFPEASFWEAVSRWATAVATVEARVRRPTTGTSTPKTFPWWVGPDHLRKCAIA